MDIAQVRLRMERGGLVVQTLAKTAKGQHFVTATTRLESPNTTAPGFKTELGQAVQMLLDGNLSTEPLSASKRGKEL